GLEDDLQVRVAGRLLDLDDLLEDVQVLAREKGATVDDHVDLVGARLYCGADLRDLDVTESLAGRESRRHRRHLDGRTAKRLLGLSDQGRIDTDRGHRRDGRVAGQWPHRLDTHRPNLAG